MDQLKVMMSNLNFKSGYSELRAHKDIFSHIQAEIVYKHPHKDQCPPLGVLCYAIKNILYPDFLLNQIPDLLDLLSNVELYHQEAIKQARAALPLYQQDQQAPLTQEEQNLLRGLGDDKCIEDRRSIYILAIFALCRLDIYQLWTSPNSYLLPLRLKEYFPSLIPSDGPSPRLFHHGLSEAERVRLHAAAEDVLKLLGEANKWEAKRNVDFATGGFSADLREFTATIPSGVDVPNVIKSINFYLKRVQTDIRTLESLFADPKTMGKGPSQIY